MTHNITFIPFLVVQNLATVLGLAKREHCPVTPVGAVTGDGRVVLVDTHPDGSHPTPFDMPLSLVLGKMPQKVGGEVIHHETS